MKFGRHVLPSLAFVFAAAIAAIADDIDDYLHRVMESQHIPGVSVAVIKNGSIVKVQGYGFADMENSVSARPETVFKIGSVSKQFIASGIMLLVQDGKLALEDKLAKYIPDAPSAWQKITIRHLLTHTAGLVREGPAFDPYKVQPDIDVIRSAYSLPLGFQPGDQYEYSNLGYFVLAEIIYKVSAKPWAEFLSERIFVPLGMTSTRATTVPDIVPNRSDGYVWYDEKYRNASNWPAVRPSGAFISTVLDLAKWEAALLRDDFLTASSKKEMWTRATLNDGKKAQYGFGWQLDDWGDSAGIPLIRHGGSMPGFRAGFARWPTHGLAVIVLTNRENANIDGIVASIAIRAVPELKTTP